MAQMLGICKALYDYASQQPDANVQDRELSIEEGELLYILEEGDDGWWKVKKKAEGEQEEGDDGLVPANYVERAQPISSATALYDYERQTTEEITFTEGSLVHIYDKDDADWFLVGLEGNYGFAPSNYLEEIGQAPAAPVAPVQAARPPSLLALPTTLPTTISTRSQGPDFSDHTLAETDEDDGQVQPPKQAPRPVLPTREPSVQASPPRQIQQPIMAPRPPPIQPVEPPYEPAAPQQETKPYRTWPVQEVEGKKKKKRGTLGLGNMEISWAPDKSSESISTWPITSLVRYSTEKKHVFIDLQGPPHGASFDFHAGSSDTATEISMYLGELAGAARAPGIREIADALKAPIPELPEHSGLARKEQEAGFASQRRSEDDADTGTSELPGPGEKMATVMYDFEAQGDDEVTVRAGARVVILDDKASRDWWKIRAGRHEGVIPADYLEISAPAKKHQRASSNTGERTRSRSRGGERAKELKPQNTGGKSKPDPSKVRSWTDRSRSFKVDAQLLGCSDGKIHLHKVNGVKISVPVEKMCADDIEYVEHKTGRSLSAPEAKPLDAQEIARQREEEKATRRRDAAAAAAAAGRPASSFDWFDFFLAAGCDPNICQRYTNAFEKEGLTEDDVGDLQPELLRRMGCKEGDVLKIGRHVNAKLGRMQPREETSSPSLISGPGGVLKNNTRRGRPERNGQVSDTVQASGLKMEGSSGAPGFEDDAWQASTPSQPTRPAGVTRNMDDLSLLDQPLQPSHTPAKDLGPLPPAQLEAQRTAADAMRSQSIQPQASSQPQQAQQPDLMQQIARIKAQQTAAAMPAFMPQTQFGSAIVAHKTGGGDISNFVAPPLYPHQTGYQQQQQILMQQQQMAMMQQQAAPFQDPFKTGSAAPYQDPFKTGVAPQMTGFVQPMMTGFVPQQQQQQPMGVFQQQPMMALQPQQTSFAQQQTGFNPAQPFGQSALPPFGGNLAPQQTGFMPPRQNIFMQPQQTGFMPQQQQPFAGGYNGFGGMQQQPQQQMMGGMMMQPQPQMSAGMIKMQEMMAQAQAQGGQQPGGNVFGRSASAGPNTAARRANLNAASASNPFGF